MIQSFCLLLIGLIILYFGAKWVVNSSSNIALYLGIKPIIIALTVVSVGTSLPEFVVSFVAAVNNTKDIALGNIIGSNIANIGLVLGLSALVKPLKINKATLKKEIPIMIGFSLLLYLLSLDKLISTMDGLILFFVNILFVAYCIYTAKKNRDRPEGAISPLNGPQNQSLKHELFLTISGTIAIVGGAKLMVDAAIILAKAFGLTELFIGMTVVAIGTSLPELATSMLAAFQSKHEMSVGTVIGSNIFNIGMVIGLISLFSPFTVAQLTLNREFLIMLGFSATLYLVVMHRMTITRSKGIFFLLGYSWFIWFTL